MGTISKIFPGFEQYKGYSKKDLVDDTFAGFTIFFTLVPQGLAYGKLAGLPPVYGMYAAAFPLYLYALFGTSRHLVFGPFAITSFMLGQIIATYQFPEDSMLRVHLALYISFISGLLYLIVWACKFGRMVTYITPNVLSGFITGCAALVALNQVTHMLGFEVGHQDYTHSLILAILEHLKETTWEATVISVPTFIFIYVCSKYKKSRKPYTGLPDTIAASSYGAMTYFLNLSSFFGFILGLLASYLMVTYQPNSPIKIVGDIPVGFQHSQFNPSGLDHDILIHAIPAALTLMLVAWMTNWAIAKKFAEKFGYEVDSQKELFSYAIVNIVGALGLNSFINAAGMARCAVAAECGLKTQLGNVIAATLMVIGMYSMGPVLYFIPMPTLGSIIAVSVLNMIDLSKVSQLYKTGQKIEATVVLVTIICTFFLGITQGLVLGIFCSFAGHLYANTLPRVYPLGVKTMLSDSGEPRSPHHLEFAELTVEWDSARIDNVLGGNAGGASGRDGTGGVIKAVPGVVIARVGTSNLYFGNASYVRDILYEMTRTYRSSYIVDTSSANLFGEIRLDTRMLSTRNVLRALVVDISSVQSLDERALLVFVDLMKDLLDENIVLSFAHQDWSDECDEGMTQGGAGPFSSGEIRVPCVDSMSARNMHAREIYHMLRKSGFANIDSIQKCAPTQKKPQYLGLFKSLERAVKYYSAQICLSYVYESTTHNTHARPYSGDYIPTEGTSTGNSSTTTKPPVVHRPRAPSGRFKEEAGEGLYEGPMSISSHDGEIRRSSGSETMSERLSDTFKELVFAKKQQSERLGDADNSDNEKTVERL